MWLPLTGLLGRAQPTKGLAFALVTATLGLHARRQRQFQIAGFKGILVVTQLRII
jgi:hypothetical protein